MTRPGPDPVTLRENPVYRRECALLSARGFRLVVATVWLLSAALSVAGLADPLSVPWAEYLFALQTVVAAVAALALAAPSIVREKEQRTWDALLLTRLQVHEIVLGKAAGAASGVGALALPVGVATVLLAVWNGSHGCAGLGLLRWSLWEMLGICAILLQVALSITVSASAKRTSDAVAGAIGGTLVLAVGFLAAFTYVAHSRDPDAVYIGRVLTLVVLCGAFCSRLLLSACEYAAPDPERYRVPGAIASAGCYLALIWMLCMFATPDGFWSFYRPWRVHALLLWWAAALLCAGAEPMPPRGPAQGSAVAPLASHWGGRITYALLLHAGGTWVILVSFLLRLGTATMEAYWGEMIWWIVLSTTGLLVCGGLGCLDAEALHRRSAGVRAGAAGAFTLLLVCAGLFTSYFGPVGRWGYVAPTPGGFLWAATQELNPATYLFVLLDPPRGYPAWGPAIRPGPTGLLPPLPTATLLQAALGATLLLAAHAGSARRIRRADGGTSPREGANL